MILDHNKVQSDKPVGEIVALGDLEAKFTTFGWRVPGATATITQRSRRCGCGCVSQSAAGNGHCRHHQGTRRLFYGAPMRAHGRQRVYRWHAGAPWTSRSRQHTPSPPHAERELGDVGSRRWPRGRTPEYGRRAVLLADALGEPVSRGADAAGTTEEYVVDAYGQALLDVARRRADVVVLDADLAADCRTRQFELAFPDRFIENGIAEQDMVSMAGGLARHGLLPIVTRLPASWRRARTSRSTTMRPSGRDHLCLPLRRPDSGGPRQSHQSLRDIALFADLPD